MGFVPHSVLFKTHISVSSNKCHSSLYTSSSPLPLPLLSPEKERKINPWPIDFYRGGRDMMIEVGSQQMVLAESSGEDPEVKAPKKRAETWVQGETKSLLSLRRELDRKFKTSKSNKHLWEEISTKMRSKGFDRSPTMCTDKWRNLLQEFKKAKHQSRGSGSAKMSYYKELDELLKERNKNAAAYKTPAAAAAPKVDSYLQFNDKGIRSYSRRMRMRRRAFCLSDGFNETIMERTTNMRLPNYSLNN